MSGLASKEGFNKALLHCADENVVKPAEGRLPIIGRNALEKAWLESGKKSISWEELPRTPHFSAFTIPFGVQLKENEDTRYKKNVFDLCNELGAKRAWKELFDGLPNSDFQKISICKMREFC